MLAPSAPSPSVAGQGRDGRVEIRALHPRVVLMLKFEDAGYATYAIDLFPAEGLNG